MRIVFRIVYLGVGIYTGKQASISYVSPKVLHPLQGPGDGLHVSRKAEDQILWLSEPGSVEEVVLVALRINCIVSQEPRMAQA